MKFWLGTVFVYIVLLGLGFGLPVLGLLDRGAAGLAGSMNLLAGAALLVAPIALGLMVAKLLFPDYWWAGQILGRDVYQFDGVFFVGVRATRQRSRLYRLLFGVDERMRRWDVVFGLLLLVLIFPHLLGGFTAHRYFEEVIPRRPLLAETMHAPTLSALPVMREWKRAWSGRPALALRVKKALRESGRIKRKDPAAWFRHGELQLLNAFEARTGPGDPFQNSPGDRVVFNRTRGAEAVASFDRILQNPEADNTGWDSAALALTGFFHLSERDYERAAGFFERALSASSDGKQARFSRYQMVLLAAQAAMLGGNPEKSIALLETILIDERLPTRAYALAMEHFADAMRLRGRTERVPELLAKTLDMYKLQKDRSGMARVHLRLAALALEKKQAGDAGREISLAASLAHGLEDGFTLNMVEALSLFFSQVLYSS